MQLTPDASLLVQILIFVALWTALKRLVFDPMSRVLDARAERTVAAEEQAAYLRAAAETAHDDYDRAVHELRAEMARTAAAARNAAQQEQARQLAAARAEASDELSKLRQSLGEAVTSARRTLAAEADTIASEMLARVTGEARP